MTGPGSEIAKPATFPQVDETFDFNYGAPGEVPDNARAAAYAARYGEPVDTYTWDRVVNAALAAAEPIIRADERKRIAEVLARSAAEAAA